MTVQPDTALVHLLVVRHHDDKQNVSNVQQRRGATTLRDDGTPRTVYAPPLYERHRQFVDALRRETDARYR